MLRTDGRTHARTDGRTDNVKTVYPLQTKFAGGINTDSYLVISLETIGCKTVPAVTSPEAGL